MVEFLAEKARNLGLSVEFQDVAEGRQNVLISLPARQQPARHAIGLMPHLDTVSVSESWQLQPEIRDGKLYGRGACDTKGSVAAMFQAIADVASTTRGLAETDILFVGLVDEECQQLGSRALASHLPPLSLAIIGEPTDCHCVTAHKGNLWMKMTLHGQAAHGATPQLGVNAIHKMADFIHLLRNDYQTILQSRSHPLLGHPTLNIGRISGGLQNNIVPDLCSIDVDRRTLPGESAQSFQQEMSQLALSAGLHLDFADSKGVDCPPMETDPHNPFVQSLMHFTGDTCPIGVSYFCDAAIIRSNGTPCVVYGPGNIAQAHTQNEWIDLNSLHLAHSQLTRFLLAQP